VDKLDEAEARVGRTLRDKWHLDSLLGVGGMAAVYAATHRNGLQGAVKVLHRSCLESGERFRREGYIANQVNHPGAVRVLDDDVDDDGTPYLVMELLVGSALHERAAMNGGKLGPEEVMLVTDELLDLLAVAHARGIIHRDIKPENLFVTSEGDVNLLDFGIAHMGEARHAWRTETVEGITMGTPVFMSPEQARARWDLVSEQSDLWSVGATMFTLLSGSFVHDEGTASETMAASFTKPARLLSTVLPDVHVALAAVVDRALLRALADRWQDANTMRAALRQAYFTMFGRRLPSRPKMRPPGLPRDKGDDIMASTETMAAPQRKTRALVSGAAVLVAALMLAATASAWALRQPGPLLATPRAAGTAGHATVVDTPAEQAAPPAAPTATGAVALRASAPDSLQASMASARAPAPVRSPPLGSPPVPHRSIYDRRY
jgi:eukaryotic-like serine/threonine-protein kinase